MPSPFPGVDPFLEASGLWEGFHERLIIHLSDLLSERVPKRYWVESSGTDHVDWIAGRRTAAIRRGLGCVCNQWASDNRRTRRKFGRDNGSP